MKVYLSGSTQHDNVGVGIYGTEESRMQFLADRVKYYIGVGKGNIEVFRNNGNMTLTQTVQDSNSKNVNAHVALHSNAGAGGKGTESYHWNNDVNSKRLSTLLYNAVSPITISPDRGEKSDHTLYDSGLYELRETNATAALIEIMFHDNEIDVYDYLGKIEQIALALAQAIYSYFGIPYYETNEKDRAIEKLRKTSPLFADKIWIPEFSKLEDKYNIWGLINIL
jgi:N-acetylmuramoyl-L-alanine amidase